MSVVAVLFGGTSLEHEISLRSGRMVLEALRDTRYTPLPVLIERDGVWIVDGERAGDALAGAAAVRARAPRCCFLALHGPFGEDGRVQAFLETAGLAYTGSGFAASALARDKTRAKRFLAAYGIRGAPDLLAPPATADDVARTLGWPVLVKDPLQGSTLGLELAANADAFEAAVGRLARRHRPVLVEQHVAGREFTVPVLEEQGRPRALPLVEIRAPEGFFDYDAKYTAGGAEEICPAEVDADTAARLADIGLRAHEALGLRGFSRTDVIVTPGGDAVFLETNSIPGLTPESLYPKAAAAAGIPFPELCARLVEATPA